MSKVPNMRHPKPFIRLMLTMGCRKILIAVCLLFLMLIPHSLFADSGLPYVEGEVLVKFKNHVQQGSSVRSQAFGALNARAIRHFPLNDIYHVKLGDNETVKTMLDRFKNNPDVQYIEPNYKRRVMAMTPNDTLFSSQWALQQIQAPDAWQTSQGSTNVVLAIADTGIDLNHQDLTGNLWANPGEICGNGHDDDGNGYADDCHGINTITGSGTPMDDEGHGTHVAGIAGAIGNNGVGVSGVNWRVSIMALKFLGADGSGSVADELKAIEYAVQKGAKVLNLSYGGYDLSESEKQAIQNAGNILFVAAACNESVNNDVSPCYPASLGFPNIISVAATDQSDDLAFFSNYGKNSVSVGAPGVSIKSTYLGNTYKSFSGTSMATPFVSGLAALVLSKYPSLSPSQLKDRILRTADAILSLQDKILTGGRINAYRALTEVVSGPHIYAVSPSKGSVGSEVTIIGSNFKTSKGTVVFGGNVNAAIVSWSDDRLVVKVPDAATGLVYVTTSEGQSNGVNFEVTTYPTAVRIAFPHASTENGRVSYLIISNPLKEPVSILTHIVGTISSEDTLMTVTLNGLEKRILNLNVIDAVNDSIFVECESQGFFGASLITLETNNRLITMPALVGGSLHLIASPVTR